MAEYKSEERREDRLNIFHYNDSTGMYKVFAINPTDDGTGVFTSIRTGVKGTKANSLSLKLNWQELAYVVLEMTRIFNERK